MRNSKLLLAAVAVAVVLAGCSGGGGGQTPTATPADRTVTATATDGGSATDGTATTDNGGTATTGDGGTTTTTESAPALDASELRSAATAAIAETDTYAIVGNVSTVLSGPATQETSQTVRTVVDREAREFRRNVTATVMGRESESTAYLVDRTLYLGSQANVRQYSSEWIKLDVSANFSSYWASQDTLGQMRSLLANASGFEVTGTDAVDGTQTAVLSVDLGPSEFESVFGDSAGFQLGSNVTVNAANYTLQVATDDGRLLGASSRVNTTVSIRGQSFQQNTNTTFRFDYDVAGAVTLPDAAEDAVNVSEGSSAGTTTGSLTGHAPGARAGGGTLRAADP